MGLESPEIPLNQVWFNNAVLYRFRGGTENRNLKWSDIQLYRNEEGIEYLEINYRSQYHFDINFK